MADRIEKASWFAPWVSKTECTLSNVFGWGAESIVFIGIKPESGKNFATEEEWPVLEKYIQAALKINPGEKGHIRGAPADASDKIEFRRIPMAKLRKTLEQATENDYFMVVSCPGDQMDAVSKAIKGNRNVLESFGSVEDLANNLENIKLGGGGAEAASSGNPSASTTAALAAEEKAFQATHSDAFGLDQEVWELGGKGLGDGDMTVLARLLPRAKKLIKLWLFQNSIGAQGAKAIASALSSCPSLTWLDLEDNGLDDEAKASVKAAWGNRGRSLFL